MAYIQTLITISEVQDSTIFQITRETGYNVEF